ncbi:hypothetical protein [Chryseolinea sp. H1M3-3]|uniref:hypothetical protein n=1 Tax=Chryseolinea sp. H1M3-3 TaxID=3034144 RepID=UPI0023ECBEBD|nr:hypothetical protein [Chryseolinea sp. H1M3-3]
MGRNPSVENVLQEKDFDKIWDYLETKFGYSKEWRIACYQYIYERSRPITSKPKPVTDFLSFCTREIDPLLNAAHCRHEYHPTFIRMMYLMFQDRIKNGKQ